MKLMKTLLHINSNLFIIHVIFSFGLYIYISNTDNLYTIKCTNVFLFDHFLFDLEPSGSDLYCLLTYNDLTLDQHVHISSVLVKSVNFCPFPTPQKTEQKAIITYETGQISKL